MRFFKRKKGTAVKGTMSQTLSGPRKELRLPDILEAWGTVLYRGKRPVEYILITYKDKDYLFMGSRPPQGVPFQGPIPISSIYYEDDRIVCGAADWTGLVLSFFIIEPEHVETFFRVKFKANAFQNEHITLKVQGLDRYGEPL